MKTYPKYIKRSNGYLVTIVNPKAKGKGYQTFRWFDSFEKALQFQQEE